jgi:hypothetical protein
MKKPLPDFSRNIATHAEEYHALSHEDESPHQSGTFRKNEKRLDNCSRPHQTGEEGYP